MTPDVEAVLKTLPRKIKVGAYDWRIKIASGENDDAWGEAEADKHLITLWPEDMPSAQFLVGILMHELLHGIFSSDWLTMADQEEAVVQGFERGLVALYRDNPKLLNWIKRGLKRDAETAN